jgi:hypothetical protein
MISVNGNDVIESCDIDQSENGGNMCEADHSAQPRNHCQTSDIQKEDSVNRDETTEQATESEDQTPPGTLIIESTSKKCTTDLPCDMSQTSNRNSVELKVN